MQVILSKDAEKQYLRLPKTQQLKVKKKLKSLEEQYANGKKLTGELKGVLSLRAWPYRILYTINEKKKRVEVLKIAHRQGVYK